MYVNNERSTAFSEMGCKQNLQTTAFFIVSWMTNAKLIVLNVKGGHILCVNAFVPAQNENPKARFTGSSDSLEMIWPVAKFWSILLIGSGGGLRISIVKR